MKSVDEIKHIAWAHDLLHGKPRTYVMYDDVAVYDDDPIGSFDAALGKDMAALADVMARIPIVGPLFEGLYVESGTDQVSRAYGLAQTMKDCGLLEPSAVIAFDAMLNIRREVK